MRPPKFKFPLRHYAKKYNVSLVTVNRWSAKGLDLDDPTALSVHVGVQKHQPDNFSIGEEVNTSEESLIQTLEFNREAFAKVFKVLFATTKAEGLSEEETLAGHLRFWDCLVTRMWKQTIRATCGDDFEKVKKIPLLPEEAEE